MVDWMWDMRKLLKNVLVNVLTWIFLTMRQLSRLKAVLKKFF